jgi:hypothetical protein
VLVALFAVIALAVGAVLLYPAITTADGEAVANDMMAAWNSGTTQGFSDVYAERVVLTTTDDADPSVGLDDVIARANEAQADGFQVERVGAFTETGQLIAFPASITTDDAGADELIVVLRYDDAGVIVEQHVIWQMP